LDYAYYLPTLRLQKTGGKRKIAVFTGEPTMSNLPVAFNEALHDKKLISRFTAGRFNKDLKWAAERQFAETAIQKNPAIASCTPTSLASCMLDCAYSGLSLSPTLAHAYLVPYKDTCTFAPGYRGLLHLAYKAGTVKSVQVNTVHEHDPEFQVWSDESGRHLKHIENQRGNPGATTHAYCIANLTAGGPPLIEVMNAAQLNAVEAQAKRKGGGAVWSGPWRDEMCKKAVLRRASKTWPKDSGGALEHMMAVADRFGGVDFDDVPADTEPPEQELCLTLDQQTVLNDVLLEYGISADVTPQWLSRYAKAKGYSSIENLPARLFEGTRASLIEYAKQSRGAK
jgi:phage RecT family recombinase